MNSRLVTMHNSSRDKSPGTRNHSVGVRLGAAVMSQRRASGSDGQVLFGGRRAGLRGLATPAQGAGQALRDTLLAITRQHLARAAEGQGGRRMKLNAAFEPAETQHPPQMGRQRHRAIPRKERPQRAPKRYSVEPRI